MAGAHGEDGAAAQRPQAVDWRRRRSRRCARARGGGDGAAEPEPLRRDRPHRHASSAQDQPDAQIGSQLQLFRRDAAAQLHLPDPAARRRAPSAIRRSTNWGQRDENGVYDPTYDLFDRSFDLQFTLLRDGEWRPWTPAVGARLPRLPRHRRLFQRVPRRDQDRVEDFKLTAGIGWGRLSRSQHVREPVLRDLVGRPATATTTSARAARSRPTRSFAARTSACSAASSGASPIDGLSFKVEYSSDDYKREQQSPASTFDAGSRSSTSAPNTASARGSRSAATTCTARTVGLQRGDQRQPAAAADPARLRHRPAAGQRARGERADGHRLGDERGGARPARRGARGDAARRGHAARSFGADPDGRGVEVAITNLRFQSDPKAIGRTTRVLAAGLPASVETFRITHGAGRLRTSTIIIDRIRLRGARSTGRTPASSAGRTSRSSARRRSRRRTAGCRDAYPDFELEHRAGAVPDAADAGRSDPDRPQPRRRGHASTSCPACRRRRWSASRC